MLSGLLTLARLGLVAMETFLLKRQRGVEQDNRARKFTQMLLLLRQDETKLLKREQTISRKLRSFIMQGSKAECVRYGRCQRRRTAFRQAMSNDARSL